MPTGRLQYCPPGSKLRERTFFFLATVEMDLHYLDGRQMGRVYYLRPDQVGQVLPMPGEQSLDALDGPLPFDEFVRRLGCFHGEIKDILTRGEFLGGIGNAYAEEVLFVAGTSPFRPRKELSREDRRRLPEVVTRALWEVAEVLRKQLPLDIHEEVRGFLQVHRKGGQPCPRCGHPISDLTANRRVTSYCRRCQPGMLVRN